MFALKEEEVVAIFIIKATYKVEESRSSELSNGESPVTH